MTGHTRIFIACSLDGFIAGPHDDLSWLPEPSEEADPADDTHGFFQFLSEVGCLLMGRNTYRIASHFAGPWPYGELPVRVATNKPLLPEVPTVQAVSGTIAELLDQAKEVAQGKDVYLDGGQMIRQALDAGLVDEICLTTVPVILGAGTPLFAGVTRRRKLALLSSRTLPEGLIQNVYRPVP